MRRPISWITGISLVLLLVVTGVPVADMPNIPESDPPFVGGGGPNAPAVVAQSVARKPIGQIPRDDSSGALPLPGEPRVLGWLQHLEGQLLDDIRKSVHNDDEVARYLANEKRVTHTIYERIDKRLELLEKLAEK